MIEILNVRKTTTGYLINGYIECMEGDVNYPDVLKWIDDKKEVMPLYTYEEITKEEILIKVQKAKKYLDETDHKFGTDYTLKEDETLEDIAEIKATRAECRTFIRKNK